MTRKQGAEWEQKRKIDNGSDESLTRGVAWFLCRKSTKSAGHAIFPSKRRGDELVWLGELAKERMCALVFIGD